MTDLLKLELKTLALRKKTGAKPFRESFATVMALPAPAGEVVDMEAAVRDLVVEAGEGRVEVRGQVGAALFFRDQDNLWRREEETFSLEHVLDLAGIKPGDTVRVSGFTTTPVWSLEEEGHAARLELDLEAVVEVWTVEHVAVTAGVAGPKELKLTRTPVTVENAVGEGRARKTMEHLADLPEEAVQIFRVAVTPREFAAVAGEDEVRLSGSAFVQILYLDGENAMRHHALELPAELAVTVPGAAPGHRARFWVEALPAECQLLETPGSSLALQLFLEGWVEVAEPLFLELVTGASGPNLRVQKKAAVLDSLLGEATVREKVVSSTRLPWPAARLLQAGSGLEGVSGTALENEVAVAGVLVQKLYCLEEGGGLFFHREDISFGAAVSLPGCGPGCTVSVEARPGRVEAALAEADRIEQAAELDIAVRALQRVELNMVNAVAVLEPSPVPARVYLVQPGDTLCLIARRFRVSLEDLLAANPHVENPDIIYPGDRIYIPRTQA